MLLRNGRKYIQKFLNPNGNSRFDDANFVGTDGNICSKVIPHSGTTDNYYTYEYLCDVNVVLPTDRYSGYGIYPVLGIGTNPVTVDDYTLTSADIIATSNPKVSLSQHGLDFYTRIKNPTSNDITITETGLALIGTGVTGSYDSENVLLARVLLETPIVIGSNVEKTLHFELR